MKQKDIRKLIELARLASELNTAGETHAANTILADISHTIAEIFERTKSNGESSSSTPV